MESPSATIEMLNDRIAHKRVQFAQQTLVIEELRRIKRQKTALPPFKASAVPQNTVNQINVQRARLVQKYLGPTPSQSTLEALGDCRSFSISEHVEYLKSAELFKVEGKISDAGFGKIGEMMGTRTGPLLKLHAEATRHHPPAGWSDEHVSHVKQWRQSLPVAPTLADVLGLKAVACGSGKTVEEIVTQLRNLAGADKKKPADASAATTSTASSTGSAVIQRLLMDNQAVTVELSGSGASADYLQHLQARYDRNVIAMDRIAPLVRPSELAQISPPLMAPPLVAPPLVLTTSLLPMAPPLVGAGKRPDRNAPLQQTLTHEALQPFQPLTHEAVATVGVVGAAAVPKQAAAPVPGSNVNVAPVEPHAAPVPTIARQSNNES